METDDYIVAAVKMNTSTIIAFTRMGYIVEIVYEGQLENVKIKMQDMRDKK